PPAHTSRLSLHDALPILSRRGLLPRAHGPHHDAPLDLPSDALTGALSLRLASARRLARAHGWRRVMEGYRPVTAELWRTTTTAEDRKSTRLNSSHVKISY